MSALHLLPKDELIKKIGFSSLPSAKITNPDVTRIINSDEVQSVVRPSQGKKQRRPWMQHKNPLVNKGALFKLNPYAKKLRRQELREFLLIISVSDID